jgi:AcrR family transcriptional regulator
MNAVFSEAKRNVIIEAALAEFGEAGFDRGSMRGVAERAGIAKGTLYLYFKDKDALFAEALGRGWEAFFVETEELLARNGSDLERLSGLLDMGMNRLRVAYPLLRGMLFETSRRELIDAKVEQLCNLISGNLTTRSSPDTPEPGQGSSKSELVVHETDTKSLLRLIVSGILFEVSTAPPYRLETQIHHVQIAVRNLIYVLLAPGRRT